MPEPLRPEQAVEPEAQPAARVLQSALPSAQQLAEVRPVEAEPELLPVVRPRQAAPASLLVAPPAERAAE